MTFQASHEIHVFHEWKTAKSSDSVERRPTSEQRLIAVRHVEQCDTKPHSELEDACPHVLAVQRESKRATHDPGLAIRSVNDVRPARRQPGVGVQEEQPAASSDGRPCIHLSAAAARRRDPTHPFELILKVAVSPGVVACHNDDRFSAAVRWKRSEQLGERVVVLPDGDDNADQAVGGDVQGDASSVAAVSRGWW